MKKRSDNRFGAIAVDKGFITPEELYLALEIQAKENIEEKKHRLLGQIMIDMNFLTEEQVEEIVETINQAMLYTISVGR
jgi:hypothetical protein